MKGAALSKPATWSTGMISRCQWKWARSGSPRAVCSMKLWPAAQSAVHAARKSPEVGQPARLVRPLFEGRSVARGTIRVSHGKRGA
jgi:hypothetical protein